MIFNRVNQIINLNFLCMSNEEDFLFDLNTISVIIENRNSEI